MNYLKGKKVYLCGNIASASDDGIGWRDNITPQLQTLGIEVLDPCKKQSKDIAEVGAAKKKFKELILTEDWIRVKEEFWPIVRYDLRCVDHSDFIIFQYNTEIPTVGSIHEIVVANFEKKPILLKYDKKFLHNFNPWMATFIKKDHFFSEWSDMMEYLREVDGGLRDTSLWVL